MTKSIDRQFHEEATRLANLPAKRRKQVLGEHWRIAGDTRLSQATRDYARYVAETLEELLQRNLEKSR